MRRKIEQKLTSGLRLFWQDLRGLWVAAAVIAGYFLVGRRVLYSLCPSVLVTGLPCPGCGLTRAVISILKGNFTAAWYLHPFSYVLLVFAVIFGVRRYILQKDVKCLMKYLVLIIIGMLVFYVYRMARYFPGDSPMSYYYGSIGYRLWKLFGLGK